MTRAHKFILTHQKDKLLSSFSFSEKKGKKNPITQSVIMSGLNPFLLSKQKFDFSWTLRGGSSGSLISTRTGTVCPALTSAFHSFISKEICLPYCTSVTGWITVNFMH